MKNSKPPDSGRYGPWEPMRGAKRQATTVMDEKAVSNDRIAQTRKYRESVRNPSRVSDQSIRGSRTAARQGLSKGSSPSTPDRS